MKTPKKPAGKTSQIPPNPAKPRKLNVRQERFCEFIASGMSGTDAWIAAGYKVDREHARIQASDCQTKPNIAARIAELRKPQTGEIRKTKAEKLAKLEEIAWRKDTRPSDVIAAIRTHNDMTGDNAPSKIEVETGPTTLDAIRERAAKLVSLMDRNARERVRQPAGLTADPVGFNRWNPTDV